MESCAFTWDSYNLYWDSHEPKVRVSKTPIIQSRGKTLHVKADWNCLLQMLAFSLESVLRIQFSLSDVILYAFFRSDLTNDQNFLVYKATGLSTTLRQLQLHV